MLYISKQIENTIKMNPCETDFHQAVTEVLNSLDPILKSDSKYEKHSILERLTEPERLIKFRVCWIDDSGKIQVNRGYRVQFNSTLGPFKGGLRFHPSVNAGVIKFLGFEQIFKNALTGLPIGGAKGGSDFDPKGKSDREIMNFCQSFMTELFRHIGPNTDVPAGDIGVGAREIGYLFGQYKKLRNSYEGVLTGKSTSFGGSFARTESTGYGLLYFTKEMLAKNGIDIKGKTACISGSGNVAIYAAQKAIQMGVKVLTMSDSSGWIYDENGINLNAVKEIKEINHGRIQEYLNYNKNAVYTNGAFEWNIPCDIALPCATQNELNLSSAKNLIKNGVIAVSEGANMPCTNKAFNEFLKNNILFAPGKAANAGGVAVSALEMSQNSMRLYWDFEKVDNELQKIMINIFDKISNCAKQYGDEKNYVMGANIFSFKKVADAMIAQGVV